MQKSINLESTGTQKVIEREFRNEYMEPDGDEVGGNEWFGFWAGVSGGYLQGLDIL